MKTFALVAIGASALTLGACVRPLSHRQPLKPISRLDCPDSRGRFERVSVAPDGKSCDYAGADGAKLQLRLVSFSGDASTVLGPVEAAVKSMMPPEAAAPAPPASSAPGQDKVDIDLPGISIHADDKNANVHVAGVHVDADGRNSSVRVNGGGRGPAGGQGQFTVNADDNGAVVRARSFGPNFEQSLIVASKTPGPQGWRSAGYEALGPKSGPLVVATFQSKADNHEATFQEVKALVQKAARGA